MLVVLTAVAATTALLSRQLTVSRAANAVPNEGFYWPVAQYQIAHHRLKQELRAVAAGEPFIAQELGMRAAVLGSRVSVLTEPPDAATGRRPMIGNGPSRPLSLVKQNNIT